jgi:hypothetical protein
MMKNKKVALLKWFPDEDEAIEIDWPKVHKTLGLDHAKWLLAQPRSVCQLVLERNNTHCRLVAEFYNDQVLAIYRLMWSK